MTNKERGAQKRVAILGIVESMTNSEGRPPTIRDIADSLDISRSACHYHIDILVETGALGRRPGTRGLYTKTGGQ